MTTIRAAAATIALLLAGCAVPVIYVAPESDADANAVDEGTETEPPSDAASDSVDAPAPDTLDATPTVDTSPAKDTAPEADASDYEQKSCLAGAPRLIWKGPLGCYDQDGVLPWASSFFCTFRNVSSLGSDVRCVPRISGKPSGAFPCPSSYLLDAVAWGGSTGIPFQGVASEVWKSPTIPGTGEMWIVHPAHAISRPGPAGWNVIPGCATATVAFPYANGDGQSVWVESTTISATKFVKAP